MPRRDRDSLGALKVRPYSILLRARSFVLRRIGGEILHPDESGLRMTEHTLSMMGKKGGLKIVKEVMA